MNSIAVRQLPAPLILVIAFGLSACGTDVPDAVEESDPWFNAPSATDTKPEAVPQSAYYPVAPQRIAEAEEFLDEISISQISPGEVAYFAGRPVELPDVTRPFLIRGLYRTKASFSVHILGNALWVRSYDEPADAASLRHQPLVLIMDEVPELIYVTTGQ